MFRINIKKSKGKSVSSKKPKNPKRITINDFIEIKEQIRSKPLIEKIKFLKDLGVDTKKIVALGYLKELVEYERLATPIRGASPLELIKELIKHKFTARELFEAGFPPLELKEAGISLETIIQERIISREIPMTDYFPDQGPLIIPLIKNGYSIELLNAGFPISEFYKHAQFHLSKKELLEVTKNLIQNGYAEKLIRNTKMLSNYSINSEILLLLNSHKFTIEQLEQSIKRNKFMSREQKIKYLFTLQELKTKN